MKLRNAILHIKNIEIFLNISSHPTSFGVGWANSDCTPPIVPIPPPFLIWKKDTIMNTSAWNKFIISIDW